MASNELTFTIKAKDDSSGTLREVGDEVERLEKRSFSLGGALKGLAIGGFAVAAAAGAGLASLLVDSAKAAADSENAMAALSAVLER